MSSGVVAQAQRLCGHGDLLCSRLKVSEHQADLDHTWGHGGDQEKPLAALRAPVREREEHGGSYSN